MRIAICFWGLTRSLKYTINSIHKNIFDVLKNRNIEYKIFLHTYKVNKQYCNKRANEYNIKLDNEEYKLLNPDYYLVQQQESIEEKINFKSFRTFKDPWNTNYETMDNFILAMYSKKQLYKLIKNCKYNFTHYLFIRPDVEYLNNFNIEWLYNIKDNDIYVPEFHFNYYRFNDRMCLTKNDNIFKIYCCIYDYMLDYSKNNYLHSESMIRNILQKNIKNINIVPISFYFNRIRANGNKKQDIKKINNKFIFV